MQYRFNRALVSPPRLLRSQLLGTATALKVPRSPVASPPHALPPRQLPPSGLSDPQSARPGPLLARQGSLAQNGLVDGEAGADRVHGATLGALLMETGGIL